MPYSGIGEDAVSLRREQICRNLKDEKCDEYAFTFHPRRDLALRYAEGSAPAPVAPTAQQGNPKARSELTAG
jgi:hypothetical protein